MAGDHGDDAARIGHGPFCRDRDGKSARRAAETRRQGQAARSPNREHREHGRFEKKRLKTRSAAWGKEKQAKIASKSLHEA